MKEPNNQNLFAAPPSILPGKPELAASLPEELSIGRGVDTSDESEVEVRFCTGGRLSAPAVLHFRDFNMAASQELADIPAQDDHLPSIVKILNTMVVENFDCGLLHLEEAKEVLLNVYGKWWGSKLSGFRYLLDPDIEDSEKLTAKENISTADIPLSALEVVPLHADIKEPINIKAHGTTIKFIFPRIRNSQVVKDLMNNKFAVEEQQFFKVKQLLKYNSEVSDPDQKKVVDLVEAEAYENYLAERAKWRLIFMRAQEICGINDTILETLDDRIKALTEDSKVSIKHWQLYTEFLEGKGKFGLKDEAEFYSDILNQKVRRPFLFYTWSLLPTDAVERTGDVDDSVSFG